MNCSGCEAWIVELIKDITKSSAKVYFIILVLHLSSFCVLDDGGQKRGKYFAIYRASCVCRWSRERMNESERRKNIAKKKTIYLFCAYHTVKNEGRLCFPEGSGREYHQFSQQSRLYLITSEGISFCAILGTWFWILIILIWSNYWKIINVY